MGTRRVGTHGANARGDHVSIAAHFLAGRLVELEVYAADGVAVELPSAASLRDVRVD